MKMKNILLSLALLGMTSVFAADNVALRMPVATAQAITQGLINAARIDRTGWDYLDSAWQYTKYMTVGALSAVGLGTVISVKLNNGISSQDMVPVVAVGCVTGGLGGAGLRWYRGDETQNQEARDRALTQAGHSVREAQIATRGVEDRFALAATNHTDTMRLATSATEEQRARANRAEAEHRAAEAARAEQLRINGEFRGQLETLERQSHMSMIGQVALAYDAARAERLNLRLLTRGEADVEAARTGTELEIRQGVLLGLGRQLWRANAPEEGIRALLPAGFQAAIEETE